MRAADHFFTLATGRGHARRPPEPLPWLTTQGHVAIEGRIPVDAYEAVRAIFDSLDGDEGALRSKPLRPVLPELFLGDAVVEFDEEQHFTIQRLATLVIYPASSDVGIDRAQHAIPGPSPPRICSRISGYHVRAAHETAGRPGCN
jgi:hypothetical protein